MSNCWPHASETLCTPLIKAFYLAQNFSWFFFLEKGAFPHVLPSPFYLAIFSPACFSSHFRLGLPVDFSMSQYFHVECVPHLKLKAVLLVLLTNDTRGRSGDVPDLSAGHHMIFTLPFGPYTSTLFSSIAVDWDSGVSLTVGSRYTICIHEPSDLETGIHEISTRLEVPL